MASAHSTMSGQLHHHTPTGSHPMQDSLSSNSPVYTDDNFMMFCFKVLPCEKTYRHDWWACPYVHPGESAKRRDPRKFTYSAVACPNAKQGGHCPRGDRCPGTHSVFEYWLHPSRFRTQFCDRGIHCNQPYCFFAHTVEQLRMPSATELSESSQSPVARADISNTATSFDCALSGGSMSFSRSNTGSFDGTSPRIPVMAEVQKNRFAAKQAPAPPVRRQSDFLGYDGGSPQVPCHIHELQRGMLNPMMSKERREFGRPHSFQASATSSMMPSATAAQYGAPVRNQNHLRSLSLTQDLSVLQDILDQMSVSSATRSAAPRAPVCHVNPPVWTPSYSNLGSPNGPLQSQGSDPFELHGTKIGPGAMGLEDAIAQIGLRLGHPL